MTQAGQSLAKAAGSFGDAGFGRVQVACLAFGQSAFSGKGLGDGVFTQMQDGRRDLGSQPSQAEQDPSSPLERHGPKDSPRSEWLSSLPLSRAGELADN
jgi:hypothetical protein